VAIYTGAKALSRWPINDESTLTYAALPDPTSFIRTSKVVSLSFDQADLRPCLLNNVLCVPRALQKFRWTQHVSCRSPYSSCECPPYQEIAQGLSMQRGSLEDLDLDIRDY
jgi:hypothetical protein